MHLPIVQLGELSELRSRRACGLTFLTPRQWVKGDFKKTKSPSALGSWFVSSVKVLVSICSLRSAIPPHYLDRTHGRAIRKAFLRSSCRLAQRSLFETSVNAHYVFLKTSKRVFRKCAFRFSKRNHPSDEGTKGALYKLKSLCALSEGKKIRSQEGTNSNFSKCMRQLPHASDKSFLRLD